MIAITVQVRGNKREVPPSVPVLTWWNRVLEVEAEGLAPPPYFSPAMEFMSPAEIARFRAKLYVWQEFTGEMPGETAWWWEERMVRRRGGPLTDEVTPADINGTGVLACGFCEARWSADTAGGHPDRCKLCDRLLLVVRDERTANGDD